MKKEYRTGIHLLAKMLTLASLLAVAACGAGDGPAAPAGQGPGGGTSGVTSLAEVQAVFNANCLTACHEPGGIGFGETGLDLRAATSYGLLFNQPATSPNLPGTRVVSLDGANSVLYQRVAGLVPVTVSRMPPLPAAPLSAAVQAQIKKWIDDGASTTGQLKAVLSGNQISAASSGPIVTAAGGSATLTLSTDRTTATFTLDAGPLASFNSPTITGAHIHARNAGTDNGPIIFDFLPATVPDPLVLSGTLSAANLGAQPNVPDFPSAVTALLSGATYFQVHSAAHPSGELRGHIGTATLTAALDGAQAVPPVVATATGTGRVVLNPDQDAVSVSLNVTGLSSTIAGAHIHVGAAGANGPVLFDFPLPATLPPNLVINLVLTAANLNPNQTTITTFAQAIDALVSGNTYFQVHTANNPGGEVRGQILPVR
jgi:CHRD domain